MIDRLSVSHDQASACRGPAPIRGRRIISALGSLFGLATLALWVPLSVFAQGSSMAPAQKLIEQERLRAAVEAAFSHYYQAVDDGNVKNDNMIAAADMLVEIGPAAVPLLANELQQSLRYNYTFVAYSLGRIGGPEAEAALRDAVAEAAEHTTDFATMRRAWACYALAMQGHLDALDLFNRDHQLAAGHWIHMDMSVLEAAALMLAPRSVPALHAQLDRYSKSEELARERVHVIKALRRIAHKDSLSKIIGLLNDDDQIIRREAADALHTYDTPESIAALMQRLKEEPLPHVRFADAWSLRRLAPEGHTAEFLELLDKEYDVHVRGALYHLAAGEGDNATFTALKPHLGRPDPRDRRELIDAMRRFDDPAATNVLRAALQDDDAHVMENGALGLTRIGGEKAIQALLGQIDSRRWLRARWALEHLVAMGEARAVPRVIARLARELEDVVMDPLARERVFGLGDTLIGLRHDGDIDDLQAGIARQGDGILKIYLASLVKRLQALQNNGDDVSAWAAALADEDPEIRALAVGVLGELGGEPAATALAAAFGRVQAEEGVEILRALGNVDSDGSRALLERVLTQEAFDPYPRLALREMAAYSARRLGGKRMVDALKAAVERRHGRDGKVLLYLMLLEGKAALPIYEKHRLERLRYLKWSRGLEQETLQRLSSDLRAGRSLEFYDVPPDKTDFRRPT